MISLSFLKVKKNFGWDHVDISNATVHRKGWVVDVNFRPFWHQRSYAGNGYWLSNKKNGWLWSASTDKVCRKTAFMTVIFVQLDDANVLIYLLFAPTVSASTGCGCNYYAELLRSIIMKHKTTLFAIFFPHDCWIRRKLIML